MINYQRRWLKISHLVKTLLFYIPYKICKHSSISIDFSATVYELFDNRPSYKDVIIAAKNHKTFSWRFWSFFELWASRELCLVGMKWGLVHTCVPVVELITLRGHCTKTTHYLWRMNCDINKRLLSQDKPQTRHVFKFHIRCQVNTKRKL